MRKPALLICAVIICKSVLAQNSTAVGSYHALSIKKSISKKWFLFTDPELRGNRFFSGYFYYEIKAGAGIKVNNNLQISAAGGVYETFKTFESHSTKVKWKVWQQALYKHEWGVADIRHRLRIEEELTNHFKPFPRYRLEVRVPLNNKKIESNTFFLTAYNEVFFQFSDPAFKRNRFFAGAGFKISDEISAQAGFVRQIDYEVSGSYGKTFVYSGLSFDL